MEPKQEVGQDKIATIDGVIVLLLYHHTPIRMVLGGIVRIKKRMKDVTKRRNRRPFTMDRSKERRGVLLVGLLRPCCCPKMKNILYTTFVTKYLPERCASHAGSRDTISKLPEGCRALEAAEFVPKPKLLVLTTPGPLKRIFV